MTTMPFGKFKGYDLEDVPSTYLVFVVEQCTSAKPELIEAVRQELACRFNLCLPSPAIDRGYLADWIRRASFTAHPDQGGSVGMMKLVNELRSVVCDRP